MACQPFGRRYLTCLTASILNSRLNFRLRMTTSGSMKHLNLVSIKPAAAHGHKQAAQIAVTLFTDTAEPLLSSA